MEVVDTLLDKCEAAEALRFHVRHAAGVADVRGKRRLEKETGADHV